MIRGTLAVPGAIHGDQLEQEIASAIGMPVHVVYEPPRTAVVGGGGRHGPVLELPPEHEATIIALIAAHVPQEAERAVARRVVRQILLGAAGKRIDDLTLSELRALIAGLGYKLGAIDAQVRVKDIDTWL